MEVLSEALRKFMEKMLPGCSGEAVDKDQMDTAVQVRVLLGIAGNGRKSMIHANAPSFVLAVALCCSFHPLFFCFPPSLP
eukprot:1362750-Rhodomonas_salina.1